MHRKITEDVKFSLYVKGRVLFWSHETFSKLVYCPNLKVEIKLTSSVFFKREVTLKFGNALHLPCSNESLHVL